MNFEPKGPTANPQIPQAQSLGDYIGRWLAPQFCNGDTPAELGIRSADAASPPAGARSDFARQCATATPNAIVAGAKERSLRNQLARTSVPVWRTTSAPLVRSSACRSSVMRSSWGSKQPGRSELVAIDA
jgi:hypothetical protein